MGHQDERELARKRMQRWLNNPNNREKNRTRAKQAYHRRKIKESKTDLFVLANRQAPA